MRFIENVLSLGIYAILLLSIFSSYKSYKTTEEIHPVQMMVKNAEVKETRIKVIIMDTGVNLNNVNTKLLCNKWGYDLTNTGMHDQFGHGTTVYNLLAKELDSNKYCFVIIKWCNHTFSEVRSLIPGLKLALQLDAPFMNLSAGGVDSIKEERITFEKLIQNTMIFLSAGNEGLRLGKHGKDMICNVYPPCYYPEGNKNMRVVGSVDTQGRRQQMSNYGTVVTDWEVAYGGTSFAAPKALNKHLRGVSEY